MQVFFTPTGEEPGRNQVCDTKITHFQGPEPHDPWQGVGHHHTLHWGNRSQLQTSFSGARDRRMSQGRACFSSTYALGPTGSKKGKLWDRVPQDCSRTASQPQSGSLLRLALRTQAAGLPVLLSCCTNRQSKFCLTPHRVLPSPPHCPRLLYLAVLCPLFFYLTFLSLGFSKEYTKFSVSCRWLKSHCRTFGW